jgi:hypothetical protein
MAVSQQHADNRATALDAQPEKRAIQVFLNSIQTQIVSVAEFEGMRTFGQQAKPVTATNHILAAAALGEETPADSGNEMGPETVWTKVQVLDYLNASFAHLGKAIDAIADKNATVKSSPISPMKGTETTRLWLTIEALIHAFDHYGQMVEYLRTNGVVPPASRP